MLYRKKINTIWVANSESVISQMEIFLCFQVFWRYWRDVCVCFSEDTLCVGNFMEVVGQMSNGKLFKKFLFY